MTAKEGTIFLDEIGETTPKLQAKLLRVLQEREFNPLGSDVATHTKARFIAATNRDLREAIPAGQFREDLYYRLAILSLELPPLRARRDDIPPLIEHFLERLSGDTRRTIDEAAMKRLQAYDWPGNVREIENLVERMVTLTDHQEFHVDDLPEFAGYMRPDSRHTHLNEVHAAWRWYRHRPVYPTLPAPDDGPGAGARPWEQDSGRQPAGLEPHHVHRTDAAPRAGLARAAPPGNTQRPRWRRTRTAAWIVRPVSQEGTSDPVALGPLGRYF